MPHQTLQGVRGERLGVDRGEGPAQIVEPVAVAGRRVLVLLVTGQVNPGRDPMLANRSATDRLLPRAGLNLQKARLHYREGRRAEAAKAWDAFVNDWLAQGRPASPGRP